VRKSFWITVLSFRGLDYLTFNQALSWLVLSIHIVALDSIHIVALDSIHIVALDSQTLVMGLDPFRKSYA
jgi:hypothetical protein